MKFYKRILYFFSVVALVVTSSFIHFSIIAKAATSLAVTVTYSYQSIPRSVYTPGWSIVSQGVVLYNVRVTAKVTNGGVPVSGVRLSFSNTNSSYVSYVVDSNPTDYNGQVNVWYEVRGTTSFTCTATVNDTNYYGTGSSTITPTLACYYDPTFYLSYYCIASEANDYTGAYDTTIPGISGYYKKAFVDDLKIQGSGYSHYGQYIKYNSGSYSIVSYPTTYSNTNVTAGKTIAVEINYVPLYFSGSTWLRAKVGIGGVGDRQAEDIGGGVSSWHIDVFTGIGKSSGSGLSWVGTYQYVNYYGNNKW